MKRVSRSNRELTIRVVWDWYTFQSRILADEKARILADLNSGRPLFDQQFSGMTQDELRGFFDIHRTELDYLTMLSLLTSLEAAIRIDFIDRVENRKKDVLSKKFRALARQRDEKIRLVEDILEAWKKVIPGNKTAIGNFKGAAKLRDWLAHGRYWNPKLGREYSPADVFDICQNLLAVTCSCII